MMMRLNNDTPNSKLPNSAMPSDPSSIALLQVPRVSDRLRFFLSSRARILARGVRNLFDPPSILGHADRTLYPYKTGDSVSDIFSNNVAETVFLTGKQTNLEIACKAIDGSVLMPTQTFSFWKMVGRPSRARGFVIGREIRSGCLIPTIGGGLCQLSGSLYESATASGLEITERHGHSRRLPNTPYDPRRDATVFWNYVDLRFRTAQPVLIEARVEDGKLLTGFRFQTPVTSMAPQRPAPTRVAADGVNDCLSCRKITCTNHLATQDIAIGRLWLSKADLLLARKMGLTYSTGKTLSLSHRIERILQSLLHLRGWPVGRIALARARFSAAILRVTHWRAREIFVSQSALPFLEPWLVAKHISYSVFAPHLPMDELQKRLDAVASAHPYDAQVRDFRAPKELALRERRALLAAKRLFIAHPFLKDLFPQAKYVGPLTGQPPKPLPIRALVFPGPLAAREGVHEVLAAARALGLEVVSYHPSTRATSAMDRATILGIRYVSVDDIRSMPGAVIVHPAVFETVASPVLDLHQAGLPVVATRGTPLQSGSYVEVPLADSAALLKALQSLNCAPHQSR